MALDCRTYVSTQLAHSPSDLYSVQISKAADERDELTQSASMPTVLYMLPLTPLLYKIVVSPGVGIWLCQSAQKADAVSCKSNKYNVTSRHSHIRTDMLSVAL